MFSQEKLKIYSKLASQKIQESKILINYFIKPYKHLVIDNFFEKELAEQCLKNFPKIDDSNWEFSNEEVVKLLLIDSNFSSYDDFRNQLKDAFFANLM